MVRSSKIPMPAEIMTMSSTLSKKEYDLRKFRDCIRSDSEKRDFGNKPKIQ